MRQGSRVAGGHDPGEIPSCGGDAGGNALGQHGGQTPAQRQGDGGALGSRQVRGNEQIGGGEEDVHFLVGDVAVFETDVIFQGEAADRSPAVLDIFPELAGDQQERRLPLAFEQRQRIQEHGQAFVGADDAEEEQHRSLQGDAEPLAGLLLGDLFSGEGGVERHLAGEDVCTRQELVKALRLVGVLGDEGARAAQKTRRQPGIPGARPREGARCG